jgi:Mg2+ and Co2+ transporter CorA
MDDAKDKRRFMFDNEDFSLSSFYFGALQLIRIYSDWIEETMEDLKLAQIRCIDRLKTTAYLGKCGLRTKDVLRLNAEWDNLRKKKDADYTALLQRCERKRKEIKNLRDGVRRSLVHPFSRPVMCVGSMLTIQQLLSATAVRDAHRAYDQNRYILVFTIMTVVYLPLTFVTVLAPLYFHHTSSYTR